MCSYTSLAYKMNLFCRLSRITCFCVRLDVLLALEWESVEPFGCMYLTMLHLITTYGRGVRSATIIPAMGRSFPFSLTPPPALTSHLHLKRPFWPIGWRVTGEHLPTRGTQTLEVNRRTSAHSRGCRFGLGTRLQTAGPSWTWLYPHTHSTGTGTISVTSGIGWTSIEGRRLSWRKDKIRALTILINSLLFINHSAISFLI